MVMNTLLMSHALNDIPSLIREQKALASDTIIEELKTGLDKFYNALGVKGIDIIEATGFDEVLLHSCICSSADKTYETMLDFSKNHNPRNDPKVQDEIRENLIKFLNRPAPKL